LNVSEHQPEQTSGTPGSLNAGPAASPSSDAQSEPVAASASEATDVESPKLVPEQAAAGATSKLNAPKAEAPKPDAPGIPGKLMIMSAGERSWEGNEDTGPAAEAGQGQGMLGKRRLAALAAVVALATVAGALGGALVTASLGHFSRDDVTSAGNRALEATVSRIDADIANLKVSVEHTSKMGMSQSNKTSDRLDKLEKAQAEPAAKLAKLSDAVEKLRAAPPAVPAAAAAAPSAAKEVTGSIAPPVPTPAEAPKGEVNRLPTVEGWVLRDVANGGALIENRRGIYEVYAGDPVPGLGRVDAIRRQDGRWVVVTSKGLIVAR
jgi:hypothetical protein